MGSGQMVYPIVSTVWGHCEVKLNYLGGLSGVIGLQELARVAVRTALGRDREEFGPDVETLVANTIEELSEESLVVTQDQEVEYLLDESFALKRLHLYICDTLLISCNKLFNLK